jgi:nucleotide-binding universal stress UspA family protein
MFESILVPLDGSPMADRILPHVASIAPMDSPQITLLRVLETNGVRSTAIDSVDWHFAKAEAQAHLDEAAKQLAQMGLTAETVLLEGKAAQRIIDYTQKHGVDLLMLSSHGQGGLSTWKVSGVAQKVIHRAGTSIMLVRSPDEGVDAHRGGDDESIRYQKILAPLDGSPRAESVLPVVFALAERHIAQLLVAHAVVRPAMFQWLPLSPEDVELAERVVERNKFEAEKYLAQLQPRLTATAQTRVLIADSLTRALHDLVAQEQVDMVVLCAHGHSCQSQWPYSALVNSFILDGVTSLLILQDIRLNELRHAIGEDVEVDLPMPTRSADGP